MREPNNPNDQTQPPQNRRASDRGAAVGGVAAGGRRRSDQGGPMPRNPIAKYAILASFLFSGVVMLWAFTLPYRTGGSSGRSAVPANQANLEYVATLSAEDYVNYTRDLDRSLLDRVREKTRRARVPDQADVQAAWKNREKVRRRVLHQMRQEAAEDGFAKGTVQWQYQQEVEAADKDTPPGL